MDHVYYYQSFRPTERMKGILERSPGICNLRQGQAAAQAGRSDSRRKACI